VPKHGITQLHRLNESFDIKRFVDDAAVAGESLRCSGRAGSLL
jgi:hypothetical protein